MTLTVESSRAAQISTTSRRSAGLRGVLLMVGLVTAPLLGACADGPQRRDEASLAGPTQASNVAAPPSVDRSKCSDKGKQVVTADTNLDKKPDVWKFFSDGPAERTVGLGAVVQAGRPES